jgi:hypothetical protein
MIYELILNSLNQWGLELDKFVGFGSDGTSMMMRIRNGVVVRLKYKVNSFILSIHCVAHRTSLASLDATSSASYKTLSTLFDNLINDTTSHFKRSSKTKPYFNELQKELYDAHKSLKNYQKIIWLSRWQSIITLCNILKNVLTYFRDVENGNDGPSDGSIFTRLRNFKNIDCLYFLADILYVLSVLSKNTSIQICGC